MRLQAVLGPQSLKAFTKCLTCLSRYGDDVILQINPDDFTLSAMNSAKTAFCRIKLNAAYFDKYKMTTLMPSGITRPILSESFEKIEGQLVVKSLLSILKHKTVEKSVEQCNLSIIEGESCGGETDEEWEDSRETKLIVSLRCKHGVIKTHKLLLLNPNDLLAPHIKPSSNQSQIIIGPRALKDIIEHFPQSKGTKNDPQLVWLFSHNDIKVKTVHVVSDTKGSKAQISTEISISADEFDSYKIHEPPVILGFLLREFNAIIALAESLSVALDLRFTQAPLPVVIELDTDSLESECLFVLSTTECVYDPSTQLKSANILKRVRDGKDEEKEDSSPTDSGSRAMKKSQSAAFLTDSTHQSRTVSSMAASQRNVSQDIQVPVNSSLSVAGASAVREPLFMPGASQLSNADLDVLRASGLGIDHMDYEEFEQMMDAEGEEVGTSTQVMHKYKRTMIDDNMALEDKMASEQLAATQVNPSHRGDKEFQPLFDD